MILGDSGPVIASYNASDPDHVRCLRFIEAATEVIQFPTPIVAEVGHLLLAASGPRAESRFLRDVGLGRITLLEPDEVDYLRAADLVLQYADFPLGAVDALIVAIAERLDVTTILTLDRRHFGAVKPLHRRSFILVP